ncbi:response regulator [Sphingobium bisphenolivorans]|uniref:response regulator n=1 Tax=Sphingobium bisphenolivorans TaxID=1335760 RepID=UPI00039B580B|nr:response regulator [Sphingobium bisphenolivorans]
MSSDVTVKFLLVDDVPQNLVALEALLARDGLMLFKARSGAEALELMLEHDFALALLDVQMPDMDGFELAEIMRSTERTRSIPIIFLTAVATDEQRRFRGYETGAVDYLFKPIDTRMLTSKAEVFFELSRQRQILAEQRDELRETAAVLSSTLDRLNAHRDNSPLAIVEFEPDLTIIGWTKGAERLFGWPADEVLGRRASELGWMGQPVAEAVARHVAALTLGGEHRDMQVHQVLRREGAALECEFYYSLLLDRNRRPASVTVQILDITERSRAEETQHLLIGELNHRVKNTLASVQAIASQTLKGAPDPSEFVDTFTGRLQALARAHSLLSNQTWQSASLSQLVQDQLDLGTLDEGRCTISGPPIELPPNLALHLALILHELGTNAAKYGALSNDAGHVYIDWTPSEGRLQLNWRESGGPVVTPPTRKGFGTVLVERSLSAEGGVVAASYPPEGVIWHMDLPLTEASRAVAPRVEARDAAVTNFVGQALSSHATLAGLDFLVVEDEPLIAFEVSDLLEDAGARVVGTAGTLSEAREAIETLDFDVAILDGNLQGQPVDPIAEALDRRGIPFLFVSGYGPEHLPADYCGRPLLNKPFNRASLLERVSGLLAAQEAAVLNRSAGCSSLKRAAS